MFILFQHLRQMPQVEVFEEKMPIFLLQEGREEEEKEKKEED